MPVQIPLNTKGRKLTALMEEKNGRIYVEFPYDVWLKDEFKLTMGARFEPETKRWHFEKNRHNMFRLRHLAGLKPYAQYDVPQGEFQPKRKQLRPHQVDMFQYVMTYKEVILAAEMGTGKTLVAIEVIDSSDVKDWWWIGPIPALAAFEQEVAKWGITKLPVVMTYDRMVKEMENWTPGRPAPQGVIFDESSRLKTWTSQRSKAARHLVEAMRTEHKDKGRDTYVVEMTGTPAPKSPLDWYPQLEVAQPGFIKEADQNRFKSSLAIVEQRENPTTGGMYPHMLGWLDSEEKCRTCGQLQDNAIHDPMWMDPKYHSFIQGENAVGKLYGRMTGVVKVVFKRDVLKDLPEKQYRVLRAKPTLEIRNAARLINVSIKNAAQQLIALRELSDGFMYESQATGTKTCAVCNGTKIARVPMYADSDDIPGVTQDEPIGWDDVQCFNCGGTGEVPVFTRGVKEIKTGKDKLLLDIFEDHEDDGRLVVYGGFTGTLERIKVLASNAGWSYICADGRGWTTNVKTRTVKGKASMLNLFQDKEFDGNLVFIGQPGAAGMGITLTAANEIVYYSNDFNGESRIQSEDRIHRLGMDINRGATITDLVQLPSDELIIENLKNKRRLQDITLGELEAGIRRYMEQAA